MKCTNTAFFSYFVKRYLKSGKFFQVHLEVGSLLKNFLAPHLECESEAQKSMFSGQKEVLHSILLFCRQSRSLVFLISILLVQTKFSLACHCTSMQGCMARKFFAFRWSCEERYLTYSHQRFYISKDGLCILVVAYFSEYEFI